jgi:hypothetical protein
MRLLALFAIAATCGMPGQWPRSRDADWVVRVLQGAGFRSHGCTGSAFTVALSGGSDLYVWAVTPRGTSERGMRVRVVAGVRVRSNRIRATWTVHRRRRVWVQAGPTTRVLPPVVRWRRIVSASVATPG